MPDPIVSTLIIVLLLLLTGVLSLIDRLLLGTWLTPFPLLSGPYTVVVLLAFTVGPSLGFVPLYTPSVLIWLAGLAAFWVGGWIVAMPLFHLLPRRTSRLVIQPRHEEQVRTPILVLSWLCVLVLGLAALRLMIAMGGVTALATDAFTTIYNSGLTGHLFAVTQLLLIYWIGSMRRMQTLDIVTLAALLAVNMLYQGKGALMIPVISGILYRFLADRLRIGLRSALLVAIAGYLMFNVVYLLAFGSGDPTLLFNTEVYSSLFYHFWSFLFAGVLGWSDLVRFGVDLNAPPSLLVEPVLNVGAVALRLNLWAGSVTGFEYMLINPWHGKVTNVMTMFGVMQVAAGTPGTVLMATLMGAGYYALFVATVRMRNCWLVAAYCFCAAVLCFGWFSYFFSLLTYFEIPVLSLAFAVLAAVGSRRPQLPEAGRQGNVSVSS